MDFRGVCSLCEREEVGHLEDLYEALRFKNRAMQVTPPNQCQVKGHSKVKNTHMICFALREEKKKQSKFDCNI